MNFLRIFFVGGLLAVLPVRAVYAPIPEQEQGKELTFTLSVGLSHDTNLFGGATGAIGSTLYQFAPSVAYNASITDQTFLSLSYQLSVDQFTDRPGEKTLDSHTVTARLAHAFSQSTTLDFVENYMVARNPESVLNGLPLNTDQSFQRNELDANYTTSVTAKTGVEVKARTIYYKYRNAALGRSIDRIENLYGVAGNYAVLPETKLVAELRHQDVYYRKLGEIKNKRSDYLMAGADYAVAKKLTTSMRAGVEWRHRSAERSATAPYAEVSAKFDYLEGSYITAGYMRTLEESSDTARFTDTRVNRIFANVQHRLTPLIAVSGSLTCEPSQLEGRRGQANVDENTVRVGVAASYLPTKNWTLSLSYDNDRVDSDEPSRNLRRERVGTNARYAF
jgi:predicted porin